MKHCGVLSLIAYKRKIINLIQTARHSIDL